NIFPVRLKDSRLHGVGIGHNPQKKYYLTFTEFAKLVGFLKLDEQQGDNPTAGWDRFFWADRPRPEPGKEAEPVRGFHNFYPVDSLKADSKVIASFIGGEATRINEGRDPQPFIVQMRFGQGKTMYIGSPETWRLRELKEAYHQRFWIKLARYMAAGTSMQKRYGYIPLGSTYYAGNIQFEAQIKGENLLPLPPDVQPVVIVKRPQKFDPRIDNITPAKFTLSAKPSQGEWKGWFQGVFKVRSEGDYEFSIPIPGTKEALSAKIHVRVPNQEMDNLRTNFPALFTVATSAKPIVPKAAKVLKKDKLEELEKAFQTPPEGADT